MNSEAFGKLPPSKLFFRSAVPAVIASVFGALYSVVDGIFVGRYLGESALAAINLVMPVIMIVEALSNMIATGSSVNMSILLGQNKHEEASGVFSFSVKFILGFSLAVSLLGLFFAKPFVMLIAPGAAGEAIEYSVEYLRVFSLFGPLIPIYFATDNYLRVCGKGRFSMMIGILTQVLNVILDFVLIVVLHKGVWAAAAASCISIALGSVITLAVFRGKKMDVYYTRGNIPAHRFFRIAANGSSEFFSNIAVSIMSVIMNLFLLKYGGTAAVAAFSIVMYVDSIVGMLNFGICDSLQPAISYCYGAGLMDRTKAIFRRVLAASFATSVFAFGFMLLAGPSVAALFIKEGDTELMNMSLTAIRIFAFSYLAGWIDMCFSSFFTALDRPARSLVLSLFGSLFFPVMFLYILTAFWQLNGVWLMSCAAATASAVLALILASTMRVGRTRGLSGLE
ncbi:MAG: MATE family efflux transporter [Clostridia bacterium]|nr:MATE family efflux transporter [Clostridia bacterium]